MNLDNAGSCVDGLGPFGRGLVAAMLSLCGPAAVQAAPGAPELAPAANPPAAVASQAGPGSEVAPSPSLAALAPQAGPGNDVARSPSAAAPAAKAAEEEEESGFGRYPTSVGLYPIWEDTGKLLTPGRFYIGTDYVGGRVLPNLQVGVDPAYYIHRAPNFEIKLALYDEGPLKVAWRQSSLLLFKNAAEGFFFSSYTSRIANPRGELLLLPSSIAATWDALPFVSFHGALTLLPELSFGGAIADRVFGGVGMITELKPARGMSLELHGGEAGLWDHDLFYFGASCRVNYAWFVGRLGYFYRVLDDGVQGSPMFSLGVQL